MLVQQGKTLLGFRIFSVRWLEFDEEE